MLKASRFIRFAIGAIIVFQALTISFAGAFSEGLEFPITVDYALPIEKMVENAIKDGNVVSAHPGITTDNFPRHFDGLQRVILEIRPFEWPPKLPDLLRLLHEEKFRPATPFELLKFTATYPDIFIKFPIVALGSISCDEEGRPRVVFLENTETRTGIGIQMVWIRISQLPPFCRCPQRR